MKLVKDLGMMYTSETKKYKARFGIYECPECNLHIKARTGDVDRGSTSRCMSCKNKNISKQFTIHGMHKTRIYQTWADMKTRCSCVSHKSYMDYGGRGISVCSEWKDFITFYEWAMSSGYSESLTIDRINNDGNYEPKNCRWADWTTQLRNTRRLRSSNTTGFRGVTYSKNDKKFVAQMNMNWKHISLGYYDTAREAGYAYDRYVIDNDLEHTTNGLIET